MIEFTSKPHDECHIHELYTDLEWNDYLKLTEQEISKAMDQSMFVVYAYDGNKLVGTGRVVSDGIINAYICGIGVLHQYRKKGIGREITNRLCEKCKGLGLHVQLVCERGLVPMYEKMGFDEFAVAMKFKEDS